MDARHFDQITKLIARRRLSRRQALSKVAPALAAGLLGVASVRQGAAEDASATPSAGDAEKVTHMFVQSFQSGSIAPKEGTDDTYTVTLEDGTGQTIYFADRPSRDVGAVPTGPFLDGLGFSEDNPPNAAIVIDTGDGETDIAVVELLNPTYDDATQTATYDVQVLANWQESLEVGLAEAPTDLAAIAPTFGPAHLFIDDCSDQSLICCTGYSLEISFACEEQHGTFGPMGFCWEFGDFCCRPCESKDQLYWNAKCNALFPGCQGNCNAVSSGCW
jgi:hypothetical protein